MTAKALLILRRPAEAAPVYVAAIAGGEFVGATLGALPELAWHAVLITLLLNHYIWLGEVRHRQVLAVLALAPLLRVISLTMPFREAPLLSWYALVGIPVLLTAGVTVRELNLSLRYLQWGRWMPQAVIGLSGLPLGDLGFVLVHPAPLAPTGEWHQVIIAIIVLALFGSFPEELIFRGIIQGAFTDLWGWPGVLGSALLSTSMYIGTGSLAGLLFFGMISVWFGWCVQRTGSLWGVTIAHSIVLIEMARLWPISWQ